MGIPKRNEEREHVFGISEGSVRQQRAEERKTRQGESRRSQILGNEFT